ncbi:MAG: DUF2953 domain-containing protein [Acetatifactor sp.]|nr:DUF2953 domain-containing protein [Acetatifactor sp.]
MLGIILRILSVVGILLLVIIGLLLVAILLALFFPVTYRVSGKKMLDELVFMAKADWLFGLLRLRYKYPEPGKMTVKFLWFTIYEPIEDSDSNQENDRKKAGKKRKNKKSGEKPEASSVLEETGEKRPTDTLQEPDQKPQEADSAETDRTEAETGEQPGEKSGSWISQKIAKIQYTIRSIYDKIKEIWQNISYYKELFADRETKQLLSYVMLRVNKILKNLRPRKLKAEILFGTGEPDTTGYAYGIYGMLMPMLGPSVLVTPDFQRAVLEGNFQASGFTTLSVLLWQVLQVIRDKRLRQFLNKLKSPGAGPKSEAEKEALQGQTG